MTTAINIAFGIPLLGFLIWQVRFLRKLWDNGASGFSIFCLSVAGLLLSCFLWLDTRPAFIRTCQGHREDHEHRTYWRRVANYTEHHNPSLHAKLADWTNDREAIAKERQSLLEMQAQALDPQAREILSRELAALDAAAVQLTTSLRAATNLMERAFLTSHIAAQRLTRERYQGKTNDLLLAEAFASAETELLTETIP